MAPGLVVVSVVELSIKLATQHSIDVTRQQLHGIGVPLHHEQPAVYCVISVIMFHRGWQRGADLGPGRRHRASAAAG
jgi:hypothetical protein